MNQEDIFDLLVIGGGINGAGIARDAAGRGLKVLLVEKDDLGSHTSSASTKLVHGGLRYLEHFEFRLVRESLIERERLLSGLKGYFEQQNIGADWDSLVKTPDERLVTTLSMVCPFDPAEKQVLLEADDLAQRCKLLIGFVESALRADNDNGNTALN